MASTKANINKLYDYPALSSYFLEFAIYFPGHCLHDVLSFGLVMDYDCMYRGIFVFSILFIQLC